MKLGLDQQTAEFCLTRLEQGDFGPDGLYYEIISLIEELRNDGIPVVDESIFIRQLQLPDEIEEKGEYLKLYSVGNSIYHRLEDTATGLRAIQVARHGIHHPSLMPYVWSAVSTIKTLLEEYEKEQDPDDRLTLDDLRISKQELDSFPDPGIYLTNGWDLWVEYFDNLVVDNPVPVNLG